MPPGLGCRPEWLDAFGSLRNAFPLFANVSSKPGCELLAIANDCLMPPITYYNQLAIGGAGVAASAAVCIWIDQIAYFKNCANGATVLSKW